MVSKVLVVSAGKDVVALLKDSSFGDFRFVHSDKLSSIDKLLSEEKPDLLLLDTNVHRLAILEFCHSLVFERRIHDLAIIILGRQNAKDEEVEAFQAGATDYFSRPFDPALFKLRLKARIVKKPITAEPLHVSGKTDRLVIDQDGYVVLLDGKALTLS
ncbi:MAG: response regulator, partial [Bacteroidota bacterium]